MIHVLLIVLLPLGAAVQQEYLPFTGAVGEAAVEVGAVLQAHEGERAALLCLSHCRYSASTAPPSSPRRNQAELIPAAGAGRGGGEAEQAGGYHLLEL